MDPPISNANRERLNPWHETGAYKLAFSSDDTQCLEFLKAWPIERLRTMTLAEYTTAGDKDCFVYWLEGRLDKFGSIWGGSAFKFGIYSRNATSNEEGDTGRAYDAQYGWYRKFGDTSAAAFEGVRAQVMRVAEAARDGRLDEIDDVSLGHAYKWKIAFHYQPAESPTIICIFQRKPLLAALGLSLEDRQTKLSELYRRIGAKWDASETIVAFSARLWRDCALQMPYEIRLPEPAIRKGVIPINLGASPFLEKMHGGSSTTEMGGTARFQTDTGLMFESDVRVTGEGKGVIRRRMADYFAQINAVPNTVIVITPQPGGDFLIARKGSAPTPVPIVPPKTEPVTPVRRVAPPLNQILFGPPGTGKTYHAIDKALEIVDPTYRSRHWGDRSSLKRRFDELTGEGLIQFVTFHQSFSYEDFIEGLRAETDEESGALRYEIVDGVFKRLCDAARTRVVQEATHSIDLTDRRIWKFSLGNSVTERYVYQECIERGIALAGFGANADFSACKSREDILRVYASAGKEHAPTDYAVTFMNAFVRQMKIGDLIVVTEGNLQFRALGEITGDYHRIPRENGDTYSQCRDVRWLRVYSQALPYDQLMTNRFSQMTLYELRDGSIDLTKLKALLQTQQTVTGRIGPRVLIIDEINRGNVSRIFGELITLIEPSKRAGADETLEAVLPYSKRRFSVPDNVHLIGTMNTADRSLAGLDIALRRRFQFVEMPARPDRLAGVIISGIDVAAMLAVMNQRIEVLLDRDHQLGHAYFMALRFGDAIAALSDIFRHQILPLLQEYFFEDWQRIAWVLNDHRKSTGARFVVPPPYSAESLFGSSAEVPTDAKLWRLDEAAFERPESYLGIYSAGQG